MVRWLGFQLIADIVGDKTGGRVYALNQSAVLTVRALSAVPTRYNEEPLQQRDTLLNYSRVVASEGEGENERRQRSFADRTYVHRAGASSAAWLVTLFPSFASSFLSRPRARQQVLSLSRRAQQLFALWHVTGLARSLRSLVCLLGHLSAALSLPLVLLASFSPSPSDSRVYSRVLAAFLRRVSLPLRDTSYLSRRTF